MEDKAMLTIEDVEDITYECPKCRTEVVFRASTPESIGTPSACPTCLETLFGLDSALAAYRRFWLMAKASKVKLRLRVSR